MATLSAQFSELLGLSEPSARFLLALFSAYPFALLYRTAFVHCSSIVQNLFFTLSGMCVIYYVYGLGICHSMVDIVMVYCVLWACGGSLLSVCLTWLITMGHLISGYVWVLYLEEVHSISWTIPHCVLVLKLIGLAYNIYDGRKDPDKLSTEMKTLSINKLPSFLEVTAFSYFYGSALAGPQIPFSRHLAFTEGRLFNWYKTPSSLPAGLQRLLAGLFFAILYAVLDQYFPISTVVSDEFAERSFPVKLFLVFVCGKVALWRYVSVWLIAEGSCILTGISYGGEDQQGRVEWHALANVHIIKFETSITLEGVINSFNLNTNKWVAWYVFKRLKFLGNKMISLGLSLLFVSIWHGVWPGYYINFSLEFLGILAERRFSSFLRRLFGSSLSEMSTAVRIPLTLAAYVLKNCILMYPLLTFMLLKWSQCYKFMSSVYFYCHVLTIGWLLLHYTLLTSLFSRRKLHKKE